MEQEKIESTGYGMCRFCGQVSIYADDENMSQGERDEKATLCCRCDTARKYTERKATFDQAVDRINALFIDEAEKYNFTVISEAEADFLRQSACIIADGVINGFAVGLCCGDTAKLTGCNNIKVERRRTIAAKL